MNKEENSLFQSILEEGNFGVLESIVFLKGFLKNYCNFIKIDSASFS